MMDEIIVVDDSKMNQVVLANMLGSTYKVACVSSGRELFDLLEECDPKLILLDVVMPDLDGFAVIEKLKSSEEYHKIPVIFITGLGDPASEERGFQLGAIDYITKPFQDNVVRARVKSYVQLYEFIKKAEVLGQRDGLTGLYNKKTTEELIVKYLSPESTLKSGALMIIDIDNFKSINDTFGHLYGDAVITQLGSALRSIFQKSDLIGRVGGDEFFVFLRNYNDRAVLEKRAEDICNEFRKTYEQNGTTVNISASIGIATTDESREFETLYKKADIALYNTKARGKNGFAFYTGEEELAYQSTRTEIENNRKNQEDFSENIQAFQDNVKEYVFNMVEEAKAAEYTIQSILQMVCNQFSFQKGYVTKFDYVDNTIQCIHNWRHSVHGVEPTIEEISLKDITDLYGKFGKDRLLVQHPGEHDHQFQSDQNEQSTLCVFSLKNKKMLLGYVCFECNDDRPLNPKVMKSIIEVCQQLSTVVINQFLIESTLRSKDQAEAVLNAISTPVYVTKVDATKPLMMNEAAKKTSPAFHGKTCIEKPGSCPHCPLQAAVIGNGFYEDDEVLCKEIKWANHTKAYVIQKK